MGMRREVSHVTAALNGDSGRHRVPRFAGRNERVTRSSIVLHRQRGRVDAREAISDARIAMSVAATECLGPHIVPFLYRTPLDPIAPPLVGVYEGAPS